jgi:hypothetical protein
MADVDQSQLKGAFDSLLSYIDKPWKVFAIAFLGVLAFTGYFIYSNQALLIGAYDRSKALPKIDISQADQTAQFLLKESKADVVAIFDVDLILNKRVLVRMYTKNGRDKTYDGTDVGMLSTNSDNNADLSSLYVGNIPCGSYSRPQSIIGFWYIQQGVTFTCRISVPAQPGEFAGQLTLGWQTPPSDIMKVQDIMTVAADMLLKK